MRKFGINSNDLQYDVQAASCPMHGHIFRLFANTSGTVHKDKEQDCATRFRGAFDSNLLYFEIYMGSRTRKAISGLPL
jgi:hypothetical protein